MTIRIVTDSSCDLPESIIDDLNIIVIPLYIHIGEKSYLDNVDINREEFYKNLPVYTPYPTTASPSPETILKTYERLAREGASQILSIHLSRVLSGTYQAAQLAVKEFKSIPVTVIDSRQLSLGFGFLVRTAAQLAQQGRALEEIITSLEDQIKRTYVFAALDTLEYLHRSGRMTFAIAGIGSLLSIKPLMKMHDGKPGSVLCRTWKNAVDQLIRLVKDLGPLEEISFVHSNAVAKIDDLRERLQLALPIENALCVNINPVLGIHVGPGGAGIACITAH